MKRVVIAMSGGVDSSVAACFLKKQGYDVIGLTLKLWVDEDVEKKTDKTAKAIKDAKAVSEQLGITHITRDYSRTFKETVVDYFIKSYRQGTTPTPCSLCNKKIKFGLLLDEAERLGASFLATGHYARVVGKNGGYALFKGVDVTKDQSYFLYRLNQSQLSRLIFPLGEFHKVDTIKEAEKLNLTVAGRPESQDLCFIEGTNYRDFLTTHSKDRFDEGPIVNRHGQILGKHKGIAFYTIGQRRGLGISSAEPLYVIELDVPNNAVVVGDRNDRMKHEFIATEVNYVSGKAPSTSVSIQVKIRYTAKAVSARLEPLPDGEVHLKTDDALFDVAPGQAAVFYRDDEVIGGGIIKKES